MLLWVAVFAAVHVLASPFEYAEGNSGRYLLPVLQDIDSDLFRNDAYVESLRRFRSGFYDLLSWSFSNVDLAPENLESAMYSLYIVSRALLVVVLFFYARSVTDDPWVPLALAVWATHQKGSPIGGESLFRPTLIHTSVALILGIIAFSFQLRRRPVGFWLTLGVAMFIHSLVAFHLAIIALASSILRPRSLNRSNALGLTLFFGIVLIYLAFMSPPSLSREEGRIFLGAKGTMNHISPINQSPLGWIEMVSWIILSVLIHTYFTRADARTRMIVMSVIAGLAAGLTLAFLAVVTDSVVLARLQPMRIFVWITFLANTILLVGTVKALRIGSVAVVPLLGVLIFGALGNIVRFPFIILAISYLAAVQFPYFDVNSRLTTLNHLVQAVLLLMTLGVFAVSRIDGLPFESLQKTSHIVPMMLLLAAAFLLTPSPHINRYVGSLLVIRTYRFLIVAAVIVSLVVISVEIRQRRDTEINSDWEVVQRWALANTAKTDGFLSTTEDNFRILSQRKAVGSASSAIVWVDPEQYLREIEAQTLIKQGYDGSAWSLSYLQDLSHEWGLEYVLVKGFYLPASAEPEFRVGDYAIFRAATSQ